MTKREIETSRPRSTVTVPQIYVRWRLPALGPCPVAVLTPFEVGLLNATQQQFNVTVELRPWLAVIILHIIDDLHTLYR